ncbi:hypothetical protein GH714_027758 [Hevea brasiliensis]|uniref:Uncharacterized protein n=1 Tax=Hevea brasiliensis TaxID=3981 RepID=A0A6A6KSN4_HEVBR|nr:hypothetical protein GH714_027758 [Hevea brasiliensis]
MRLSLPTARQNEVQRGWRRAGRLLGRAGRWEAQNEVHGSSLAHNGPVGRAGRVGAARGQTRRETRFIARERERGKGRGARDAYGNEVQTCAGRLGGARGGRTRGQEVTMADQSEITLGVGVAPTVVEHEGGRRKGRGKSRDPSRGREDLGDLEKRLAKVELHLVDGEERFEEVDTRLMELDERMEELRGDMQGTLNTAIDKLASEGESLRLSQMGEIAALRDENRSLKEQLEWAMGKLKEVEQQVSLVAMAVARGGVATTSGASLVIPSRVEVPKPSVYGGARNAKEIDNFLWSLEQYFRALGIMDDAKKVDHAPLYLVDTAMVW